MCTNKKDKLNLNHQLPEKSWMQFVILRVICEEPSYGYKIIEDIETITGGYHKIKTGTVYTLLRRMEKKELLSSKWEGNKKGPDKRIYDVTQKGRQQLKIWLEMVVKRKPMVDNMVDFYNREFKDGN